jgi:signal transduction histidine kinase
MLVRARKFLHTRTGRLALTYLAIIMAMTIVFSVVIFVIASNQFDRPLPAHETFRVGRFIGGDTDIDTLFSQRASEAKAGLLISLLTLNVGMLAFGVWFSIYLARLTMEPIEHAMEEQSRFVSDASHELRTPLTALQSMNEVALRRKKITEQEARELAAANVEQAAKLHGLTSSLLGLIATSHDAKLEPVDLQGAVGDAMATVVTAAQQKNIAVDDQVPSMIVKANQSQLVQVIRILLDNAVKYSKEGGKVIVSAKPHGTGMRLSVIDKGVGIHEQDLPHIFSRFYRADASRSKVQQDGYGIGLAIAKSISDHMGWNISVRSTPGKGSTFSLDLPLNNRS